MPVWHQKRKRAARAVCPGGSQAPGFAGGLRKPWNCRPKRRRGIRHAPFRRGALLRYGMRAGAAERERVPAAIGPAAPRCKPVRCRAAGAGPSSVCRTQPRAAFSDDVRLTLRGAGARRVLPEQPPDKDAVLKQRAQHPVYRCKQDEQRAEHTEAQRGKPISMGFEAPYAHTQPVHFPTGPDAEADGHEQADRQRIILCSAAPSLS